MFQDRLIRLRNEKKLTRQEAADMLNMNARTYKSYERDEREPCHEVLKQIALFYNVTVDYLIGMPNNNTYSQKKSFSTGINNKKDMYNDKLSFPV